MLGGTWNCNTIKFFTPKGVNVITIKMQLVFNRGTLHKQITAEVATTATRENARKITTLKACLHPGSQRNIDRRHLQSL